MTSKERRWVNTCYLWLCVQHNLCQLVKVEVKVAQTKEALAMQHGRSKMLSSRNYCKLVAFCSSAITHLLTSFISLSLSLSLSLSAEFTVYSIIQLSTILHPVLPTLTPLLCWWVHQLLLLLLLLLCVCVCVYVCMHVCVCVCVCVWSYICSIPHNGTDTTAWDSLHVSHYHDRLPLHTIQTFTLHKDMRTQF